MEQINRQGTVYTPNLVDSVLSFNSGLTFTISSGTGTAVTTGGEIFYGQRYLKMENTAPASALVATYTNQSTVIVTDGDYGFSVYLKKTQAEDITGKLNIFKNAVLLSAEAFDMTDLAVDTWHRFVVTSAVTASKNDDFTFTFEIDGIVTGESSIILEWDGLMVYPMDRVQKAPPFFTPPSQGSVVSVVSVSAAYGASNNEFIKADASGGAFTITLPAASASQDNRITIKKTDVSVNTVTVDGNAAETIDGQLTQTLTSQWDSLTVVCDGANWYIE